MSGRHRVDSHPVICGRCRAEIEHCVSENGWMHSRTRSERCEGTGALARPQTEDEFERKRNPARTSLIRPDDGDPRHGTQNGYANLRCRCEPCKQAVSEYAKAWRAGRSVDA